jgi:hypothetical protein
VLVRRDSPNEIDILEIVTVVLNSISDPELQRVFRS